VRRAGFTREAGHAVARALAREGLAPGTVVVGIRDVVAIGVMSALREAGREVGSDVAVAGFDDIPFAALSTPALTTASHPVDRIATGAATAILEPTGAPPATFYATELIHRDSA
jgi:LacI family transcriptional regulator, galactose operon repressor